MSERPSCHHLYDGPPSGAVQNSASSASSASLPTSRSGTIGRTCAQYPDLATGPDTFTNTALTITPVLASAPWDADVRIRPSGRHPGPP
jgi:hypothetical protein